MAHFAEEKASFKGKGMEWRPHDFWVDGRAGGSVADGQAEEPL